MGLSLLEMERQQPACFVLKKRIGFPIKVLVIVKAA